MKFYYFLKTLVKLWEPCVLGTVYTVLCPAIWWVLRQQGKTEQVFRISDGTPQRGVPRRCLCSFWYVYVHNVLDHTMNRLCDVAARLHPTHTYCVWSVEARLRNVLECNMSLTTPITRPGDRPQMWPIKGVTLLCLRRSWWYAEEAGEKEPAEAEGRRWTKGAREKMTKAVPGNRVPQCCGSLLLCMLWKGLWPCLSKVIYLWAGNTCTGLKALRIWGVNHVGCM